MLGQLCLRGLRHRVGGVLKAAPCGLYKHAFPACLSRSLSQGGDASFGSPSAEDQLQYAQRLALQAGRELPEDAAENPEACSTFIDKMLSLVPASDEQIHLAEKLAMEAGESLPDDAIASAAAISAYIAKMSPDGAEKIDLRSVFGDAISWKNPPSEKQLKYAQSLALEIEQPLPLDAHEDSQVCSAFIDEVRQKVAPTEKQLRFAETLAGEAGEALPEDAIKSKAAISEYIESMMQSLPKKAKAGGPSQKQLDFAADLARTRGVRIPAEALKQKHACSAFIDSMLGKQESSKRPMHTSSSESSDWQMGGMTAQTQAPPMEHEAVPF